MKRKSARKNCFGYGQLELKRLLAADIGFDTSLTLEGEINSTALVAQANLDADSTFSKTAAIQSSDVVLGWNNLFGDLLVDSVENQNPGYASRSMAILNLAVYDAVTIASGDPSDSFYDYSGEVLSSSGRISAEVTASQAAFTVLSALYPDQQAAIDAYAGIAIENSRSTAASLAVGTEIGNTILANRANDGSDVIAGYDFADEIGSFQADPLNPDVPVWGPAWGEVDTFAISSAEDFVPASTPELTSEQYAASYNEVLELGAVDSATRTADQTEAGIFWAYDREGLGTPLALFSDVLESIAVQQENTLQQNAALYAQASVAMADAAIVAWKTKFSEGFWRPVTAIHEGDNDGNPLTEGDSDWTALGAPDGGDDVIGFTPQFPTYISGHATFGGALFGAIREFYGTDDIAFDLASAELEILIDNPELQAEYGLELDDATRSFDTLTEAMAENGRSRVYLGIHFDFDDIVGQEVGQAVASEVSSEFVVASSDMDEGGNRNREDDGGRRQDRHQRANIDRGRGQRLRTMRGSDRLLTDFNQGSIDNTHGVSDGEVAGHQMQLNPKLELRALADDARSTRGPESLGVARQEAKFARSDDGDAENEDTVNVVDEVFSEFVTVQRSELVFGSFGSTPFRLYSARASRIASMG